MLDRQSPKQSKKSKLHVEQQFEGVVVTFRWGKLIEIEKLYQAEYEAQFLRMTEETPSLPQPFRGSVTEREKKAVLGGITITHKQVGDWGRGRDKTRIM